MMMKSESSTSASNKITDIVRLQQILKKWKKLAVRRRSTAANGEEASSPATTAAAASATNSSKSGSISINKLLKKTLSFSENVPPKGYVAVCVGKELKRFVIPMEYLGHQSFAHLLREAEEEFGFQQEGVLKFPCHVSVFDDTLKMIADNDDTSSTTTDLTGYCERHQHHHPAPPQMCR